MHCGSLFCGHIKLRFIFFILFYFHFCRPPGVLNTQLAYDISLVQRSMVYTWMSKMTVAGTATFMVVVCLVLSWRMTLVVLVVGPLVALSGFLAEVIILMSINPSVDLESAHIYEINCTRADAPIHPFSFIHVTFFFEN